VIFLTVGGQLPFDRLVRSVDEWAARRGRSDVFAQIGSGQYRPRSFDHCRFLPPAEFQDRAHAATAIVSHAGIGVIVLALEAQKPLLVFPRRCALGEHRNDHQLDGAQRFEALGTVRVVYDEGEARRRARRPGNDPPGLTGSARARRAARRASPLVPGAARPAARRDRRAAGTVSQAAQRPDPTAVAGLRAPTDRSRRSAATRATRA
jgi:UDP-N-acetylglucosamine transferase subunit ALG13